MHNLGHPRPYFPLPKHSVCSHSKWGYFRLSVHTRFSALVVFSYDSVFIINRVGSRRSAFPETGRDGTSLTLNADMNYCSAPWPVPQLTSSPGQALPAADGGVPRAHRREWPRPGGPACWRSVLGLIFVISLLPPPAFLDLFVTGNGNIPYPLFTVFFFFLNS